MSTYQNFTPLFVEFLQKFLSQNFFIFGGIGEWYPRGKASNGKLVGMDSLFSTNDVANKFLSINRASRLRDLLEETFAMVSMMGWLIDC
ncbi:unnamed protein product [Rhizophagus irregularis]|uniref:Uncharacterized protein n=1 Tax=Rhizophagus irregularis TaxID=588596 RepID=A0A915YWC3_9GLOM|nr:unnamed protein product [Rhizophagus irregularis]